MSAAGLPLPDGAHAGNHLGGKRRLCQCPCDQCVTRTAGICVCLDCPCDPADRSAPVHRDGLWGLRPSEWHANGLPLGLPDDLRGGVMPGMRDAGREPAAPEWEMAARAAGWLSPADVRLEVWRARNLNGERCRWCGVVRVRTHEGGPGPQDHRPRCRFYAGPVEHRAIGGHMGSFGWWVQCACGRSYPEFDADGGRATCPEAGSAFREAREVDLLGTP